MRSNALTASLIILIVVVGIGGVFIQKNVGSEPADCFHTYNLSFFSHSDRTIRSVFMGYPEKGMTVAKTAKAQMEVSVEGDGVLSLISVQYIGCEDK